jgi:uncharacterized DUF497 family protein
MKIGFDPAKRDLTLRHRGLDFAQADDLFAGRTATVVDDRRDYGEMRFITAGHLDGRLVTRLRSSLHRTSASSANFGIERTPANIQCGFWS